MNRITPQSTIKSGELARMNDDALGRMAAACVERVAEDLVNPRRDTSGSPPMNRSRAIAEQLTRIESAAAEIQAATRALGAELVDHMAAHTCEHAGRRHNEYRCPDCRATYNTEPADRMKIGEVMKHQCDACGYFGSEWVIVDTCDDCGGEVKP